MVIVLASLSGQAQLKVQSDGHISLGTLSGAQEEGIIYTDFNPDLCISTDNYPNCFYDTIKIDFDQNGAIDFKVFLSWRSTGEIAIDMLSSWEHRFRLSSDDSIVPMDGSPYLAKIGQSLRYIVLLS